MHSKGSYEIKSVISQYKETTKDKPADMTPSRDTRATTPRPWKSLADNFHASHLVHIDFDLCMQTWQT